MRQQQQQRSRNRNRGRKSSNPLSRNFESNGPDVKIRGNANHIAEKYSVLARDALTSGDTVMAENYFQHAEHYFRIVAIAQKNSPQPNNTNNAQSNRSTGDSPRQNTGNGRGDGPQPELESTPAEVDLKSEKPLDNDSANTNSDDPSSGDEQSRTRRNGRRPANTRRTTSRATAKEDESGKASSTSDDTEGLSEDAASLPSGLIG